ncbi:MAG: glycine--tRNA ligase subunit beta [Thermodesulfovibrionales bacterium]|nr:glycine--tRNA ligase subunit beta [Thermodesulfovibrionales bacterium]
MNQEIKENLSPASTSSLLLEIGTEDIPARFLPSAIKQLKENSEAIFKENHIKFSGIKTYGSPRRFAMIAEGLPLMQEDISKEVFGPSKKIAFDENGKPTKAATGFSNSQGVSVESLVIKNNDKGEYVVAVIEEKGAQVREILPEILKKVVLSIHLPKSMRWGNNNLRFIRPIRWLLALLEKEVVNFEIDGIKSSNTTRGHRFLSPAAFQIKEITNYVKLLANNNVIVDFEERKKIISAEIEKISASVNGSVIRDEALLETVANIVEYPVPVLAAFSEEYLKLPKELLIIVMKAHQKYFAIENKEGRLTNYFIIVSNTTKENSETVKAGAERVIKARFEDAKFYFEEDGRKRLGDRVDELKNVTYQEKLGSIYEKILRVKQLSVYLASKLNPLLEQKAGRAALLSKTDLITGVVREFPELQGIMGRYYALNDAEDKEVADALMEQYLPAYQGDRLPETETGALLSLADKIDSIISFFSIGLIPTGSEDPFALRRQTLAVIAIMLNKGYDLPVSEIINEAFKNLKHVKKSAQAKETVLKFFEQRLEPLFSAQGYSFDEIQSILSLTAEIPLKEIEKRLKAIKGFKNDSGYNDFITAIKRVKNIIPETKLPALKLRLLTKEPEKKLNERLNATKAEVDSLLKEYRYTDALRTLSGLTDPINNFFDNVLVMDKQDDIKFNRLALLRNVWAAASSIADFSKL